MGLFDFLKAPTWRLHPDTFALDRVNLYARIEQTIREQLGQKKTVILAAHFPDEFFRLQDQLAAWNLDYCMVTRSLDRQWMLDYRDHDTSVPFLSLAEMLIDSRFHNEPPWPHKVALMMLDRHPLASRDESLKQLAAQFPASVELGYFMAMDDRILRESIPASMIDLLRQMGFDDHGLITSSIVFKRVRRWLAEIEKDLETPPVAADSVEQWFDLNVKRNSP